METKKGRLDEETEIDKRTERDRQNRDRVRQTDTDANRQTDRL